MSQIDLQLERRMDQLDREMAILKNENKHVVSALSVMSARMSGMNDKKLVPMQVQLNEIHQALHGSKGFWAGVIMTVGAVWAITVTLGVIIYKYLGGSAL